MIDSVTLCDVEPYLNATFDSDLYMACDSCNFSLHLDYKPTFTNVLNAKLLHDSRILQHTTLGPDWSNNGREI